MKSFRTFLTELESYVGEHSAPDKSNGAPMHNVSPHIYPEDIHSHHGASYYGDNGGDNRDHASISHIQNSRNKPLHQVKIYRAVPHIKGTDEQITELEKHKAYILKTGKVHPSINTHMNSSDYFGHLNTQIEDLKSKPNEPSPKMKINPGDWVTQNRDYAKSHGEGALNGKYKIISKTVPAKHLYTDGNSIHEWGYSPD